MSCIICDAIAGGNALYDDGAVVVLLDEHPAAAGQSIVTMRRHFSIIEQVPDALVGTLFSVANKVSTATFEALGAQGTNLLVSNGIAAGQEAAHALITVVPRMQGDGLLPKWKPKQLSEEEMSTVELMLKEQTKHIGAFEEGENEPVNLDAPPKQLEKEDDYLLRQLRRIP